MAALHHLLPLALIVPSPCCYLGVLPGVAGAVLNRPGGALSKDAGPRSSRSEAAHLVEVGPFRFSRNPIYLGLLLRLAGVFGCSAASARWLVVAAFGWLITTRFVALEERMRDARFGEACRYRTRVRRRL